MHISPSASSEIEMDDSQLSITSSKSSYFDTRETGSFSKYKPSMPQDRYINVERKDKINYGMKTHETKVHDEDFFRWVRESRTTDIKGGIAALVKGCIGGGMLCLHESYKECGMLTALMLNVFLGVIISYCMYDMARSSKKLYDRTKIRIVSYPDLVETTCYFSDWYWLQRLSRPLRHVVEVLMCADLFGSCSVYQVMVARAVFQLVEGPDGQQSLNFETVRLYIGFLIIPFSMLAVFVPMKHLVPFSITLNFFIVMLSLSTIYYACKAEKAVENPLHLPLFKSFTGMCELIGNTLYAIDGVRATLAVEKNIRNPKDFPMVVLGGMPIVVVISMIIGAFGNWGWGDQILSPITLNFPWTSFSIPLKMFMILVMYVTFGINFWVPANMVWYYVSCYHDPDSHYLDEKVWRFGLVLMTIMVSVAFPNITKFLAVLGCFNLSMMSFVIPALISLVLDWKKPGLGKYHWRALKAGFLITLGLIIFTVGTTINAIHMAHHISYRLTH